MTSYLRALLALIVVVHATTETAPATVAVKFENLRRTPSQALIQYCEKYGFTKPIEAHRYAHLINTADVNLEWFSVSTYTTYVNANSHASSLNAFPYRLSTSDGDIVLVLSNERSSTVRWYIVIVKHETSKLYWAVCDKKHLASIDEDNLEVVKKIPPALLSFASNPFKSPQIGDTLEN